MYSSLKITITLVLLFFGIDICSQSIILRQGLTISNMYTSSNGKNFIENKTPYKSVNFGLFLDWTIHNNISVETGVLFTTRGFRQEVEELSGGVKRISKNRLFLFYSNVPIDIKIKYQLKKVKLFNSLGPYIGRGLIGSKKVQLTASDPNLPYAKPVNWGHDETNDDIRNWDYGISISGGLEFYSIQLGLKYSQGLSNVSSNRSLLLVNQAFEIYIGYNFGHLKW